MPQHTGRPAGLRTYQLHCVHSVAVDSGYRRTILAGVAGEAYIPEGSSGFVVPGGDLTALGAKAEEVPLLTGPLRVKELSIVVSNRGSRPFRVSANRPVGTLVVRSGRDGYYRAGAYRTRNYVLARMLRSRWR